MLIDVITGTIQDFKDPVWIMELIQVTKNSGRKSCTQRIRGKEQRWICVVEQWSSNTS